MDYIMPAIAVMGIPLGCYALYLAGSMIGRAASGDLRGPRVTYYPTPAGYERIDMEMKAFVVRSDVNNRPAWIKLNVLAHHMQKYDVTEERRIAHLFADFDDAQGVADNWSDVPGVWRVERV
jgi:hypothetical protein